MNEGSKKERHWYALLVILLNPLIFLFFVSTKSSFPDTFAYLAQAENIYNNLLFHTGPWGHIDSSLILAPLYPFLIAIVMNTGIASLQSAIYVSLISGLLFSLLSFYYLRKVSGPLIAMVTVLTINVTYAYFNIFSTALTESVFLLTLLVSILALTKVFTKNHENNYSCTLLAGFFCALAFLTRELGITIFITGLIVFLFIYIFAEKKDRSRVIKKIVVFACGFFILVLPFQTIRSLQTNTDIFSQSFRLGEYVISTDKAEIITEIEIQKNKIDSSSIYEDIYRFRRDLMKLLPDSSEMLSYVVYSKKDSMISKSRERIKKYLSNFIRNIEILADKTGYLVLVLFFLSCFSIFFFKQTSSLRVRVIIPVFLSTYIAFVSYFTGEVSRYIDIMLPFVWFHLCLELNILFKLIKETHISAIIRKCLLIFLCPAIVFSASTGMFYEKRVFPENNMQEDGLHELKQAIHGQAVFTQFPYYAYSVGGQYRQLPNDSFEKLVRYGNSTGVNWLLIVDYPEERKIMQYWSQASSWMFSENLEQSFPELVPHSYSYFDSRTQSAWRLYEIQALDKHGY